MASLMKTIKISLDVQLLRAGKQQAAQFWLSFAAYVRLLLNQDLRQKGTILNDSTSK